MSGLPNSPAKCLLQRHDPALYEAELGGASELTLHANNNHPSETQPAAHSEPKMGASEHDQDQDQDRPLVLTEYEAIYHIHSQPSDKTPIVLTFGPHDVDDPRNWSKARKWYITCLVSMLNVLTCLCAGGYSSGSHLLKEEFHCSSTMATLGLSNYILGFAFGPMLLAPLSEHWGRNPIYIWSWLLLVILQVPAALAGSISTLVGIRFLQGLAGSAPLTNTGGTIADLWERHSSGAPMAIYGLSSTLGPPLALPLTGYLAEAKGWRFLFWFFMAVFGFTWLVLILTLPETRHPVILAQKRHRLQKQMKAAGYKAAANIKPAIARDDLAILFKHTLTRPIRFLFTEPITFSTALYNGLIYGLVFLFNESFPLVFGHLHNFSHAQTSLTFLGLCIGSLIGAALHPLQERHYAKVQTPEARVWLSLPGCFLLPISLFWFAACSVASVPWIIPVIASVLFGTGIFIVVLGVLNFVLDSYGHYTASALAGVILVRNIVGAIFPLFAENMYEGMGYRYAGVLLGFLALCFCVVPFGFYYFGVEIRRRSKYARRSQDAAHNTVV